MAQKVHSNEGIDIALCNDALDALEAALFGTASAPPQNTPKKHTGRNVFIAVVVVAVVVIGIVMAVQNTPEKRAKAHFDRAISFYHAGDYNSVIREYTEAIILDPNYIGAYILRGEAYRMKGEYIGILLA